MLRMSSSKGSRCFGAQSKSMTNMVISMKKANMLMKMRWRTSAELSMAGWCSSGALKGLCRQCSGLSPPEWASSTALSSSPSSHA